jgi:hypothetical protein
MRRNPDIGVSRATSPEKGTLVSWYQDLVMIELGILASGGEQWRSRDELVMKWLDDRPR